MRDNTNCHAAATLAPNSDLAEIGWPAIPKSFEAKLLAILFQLEQSQWWPRPVLVQRQMEQLARVLAHARATVPFYRDRCDSTDVRLSPETLAQDWAQIPIVTRGDVQAGAESLHSIAPPQSHGRISRKVTSGSTGMPISAFGTEVTQAFWRAFTVRDHLWHRRDFSQPLASIREVHAGSADPPHGRRVANWGATRGLVETGPAHVISIQSTVEQQAAWLSEVEPGYLLAYPSTVHALASHFAKTPRCLRRLREVRTFGEVLDSACRKACEDVFQVPMVDMYSSQEVGCLALQCPERATYHVQSENLFVEVLKEDGTPCVAGEIGRVVVSTLHNFAMPLIRYELGDYAEVGEPCACGRGLPVLTRILGRQRNVFSLPNGRQVWPSWADAASLGINQLPPVTQVQVIQRSLEFIEVLLVASRSLTADEEANLRQMLVKGLGHPFSIAFRYVDAIARSANGKFEDFRSEIRT